MSNMSYCRFENTLADLRDCEEHIDDALSADEASARKSLIRMCHRIARGFVDDEYEIDADALSDLPVTA